MMTRDEFYELIGYREYEERDSRVSAYVDELYKTIGFKNRRG